MTNASAKTGSYRSVRTVATVMGARVFGAMLGLLFTVLLARLMTPAEMGRAMTAMSLGLLLPIIATGSAEAGSARFVTQALQRQDLAAARGFLRMNWQVAAICAPLLLAVGTIFVLTFRGDVQPETLLLAILGASILGLVRIGSAHAMGFSRVILATLPQTFLRQLLMLVLVGGFWLTTRQSPTASGIMVAFVLSAMIIVVIQQLALRKSYALVKMTAHDSAARRPWLQYGLQMGAALLFVEYGKDITILCSALSLQPDDVARLSVALSLVGFARFGLVAVNQTTTPDMSRALASGDMARLIAITDHSNLSKVGVALVALLVFVLFGKTILGVYNDHFASVWWLLPILMSETLAMALLGPSSNVLSLSGNQRILMWVSVALVPFLACFVAVGAAVAGLGGAAFGAMLAWVAFHTTLALAMRRRMGLNLTFGGTLSRMMRGRGRVTP